MRLVVIASVVVAAALGFGTPSGRADQMANPVPAASPGRDQRSATGAEDVARRSGVPDGQVIPPNAVPRDASDRPEAGTGPTGNDLGRRSTDGGR